MHHPDAEARKRHQAFVDFMIPIVKGCSTEVAQQVTYLALQVHGGMGFIEETGAAQHYRDARITTIYEGTTGIQANDLIGTQDRARWRRRGRAVLAPTSPRSRPQLLRVGGCRSQGDRCGARRGRVVAGRGRSTGWWPTTVHRRAPRIAAAVPYLQMWGLVAGGWQLGRGALIAVETARATAVATPRSYAARSPPRASTPSACCRRRARSASRSRTAAKSVLALADEQF